VCHTRREIPPRIHRDDSIGARDMAWPDALFTTDSVVR